MKKGKNFLLGILLISLISHLAYSMPLVDVEFTRVIINGKIKLKPLPENILIQKGSTLKLYYDIISTSKVKNVKFNVYLNGKKIYSHFPDYSINLNDLVNKSNVVKVSSVINGKENGSATKVITVLMPVIKDSPKEKQKEPVKDVNIDSLKNLPNNAQLPNIDPETIVENKELVSQDEEPSGISSNLLIILIMVIVLQTLAIIGLVLKKPKKVIATKKTTTSYIDNETYQLMKKGFAALEKQNRNLKSKIKKLAKIKSKLEDANLELHSQKERLEDTKNQLEIMGEKKDELIATALHDIKNPAAAISGLIELLNTYDLTAQEQQEIMESLVSSSSRVLELATEVSQSFANQEYDSTLKLSPSLINDTVNSVIKLNFTRASKKKITLAKEVEDNIPEVNYDPSKIEEVLDNMVNNAIKYSPSGTEVLIKAIIENNNVIVSVVDNGVGIPKEELPKIFDKGTKLSPRPTGGESSSGLGMWIVKKIINQHGGRVWAKSKVGEGSTFGFDLPIES